MYNDQFSMCKYLLDSLEAGKDKRNKCFCCRVLQILPALGRCDALDGSHQFV